MKIRTWLAALLFVAGSPAASPQEEQISVNDFVQLGQQFLEENVDPEALSAFEDSGIEGGSEFLTQLQEKLNSEYVIDVAELKKTATVILPFLDAYEETAPYAAWLKTRLDYLEAAEQLRKLIPAPKTTPDKPATPAVKPSAVQERKVWQQLFEKRPVPKSAEPYVTKLKPVFAAHGVPKEMVWLAEGESSFNPKAKSPAGAAGLFQLMPDTATSLGLSVRWPDERLNPDKAAPATAKYLNYLYGRFGDWKLALAAYNVGEGRLKKLMQKHKARTFDEVSPWLPAETQMYVPKFEAILQKREGLTLAQLTPPKSSVSNSKKQ